MNGLDIAVYYLMGIQRGRDEVAYAFWRDKTLDLAYGFLQRAKQGQREAAELWEWSLHGARALSPDDRQHEEWLRDQANIQNRCFYKYLGARDNAEKAAQHFAWASVPFEPYPNPVELAVTAVYRSLWQTVTRLPLATLRDTAEDARTSVKKARAVASEYEAQGEADLAAMCRENADKMDAWARENDVQADQIERWATT